jgi:hypothetical protein
MFSETNARESAATLSPLTPGAKTRSSTERCFLEANEWTGSSDWNSWSADCATYACLWGDESTLCSLWSIDERECQQVQVPVSAELGAPTLASPAQSHASKVQKAPIDVQSPSRVEDADTDDQRGHSDLDALTEGSNLLAMTERTVRTAGGGVISVRFRDEDSVPACHLASAASLEKSAMHLNYTPRVQDKQFTGNCLRPNKAETWSLSSGADVTGTCSTAQWRTRASEEASPTGHGTFSGATLGPNEEVQRSMTWAVTHQQALGRYLHGRRVHAPLTLEITDHNLKSNLKSRQLDHDDEEADPANPLPNEPQLDANRSNDLTALDIGIDEAEYVISRSLVPPDMLEAESILHCEEWLDEWTGYSEEWRKSLKTSSLTPAEVWRSAKESRRKAPVLLTASQKNEPAIHHLGGLVACSGRSLTVGNNFRKQDHYGGCDTSCIPLWKPALLEHSSSETTVSSRNEIQTLLCNEPNPRERTLLKHIPAGSQIPEASFSIAALEQVSSASEPICPSQAVPARKRMRPMENMFEHRHSNGMTLPPLRAAGQIQPGIYDMDDLGGKRALRNFVLNRIEEFRRSVPMLTKAGPFWHLERDPLRLASNMSAADLLSHP